MPLQSKFEKLKTSVSSLQRKYDQSIGLKKAALKTLKKEFDCSTEEEGRALLKKLQSEAEQLEKKFSKAIVAFEKKWGFKLEENDE